MKDLGYLIFGVVTGAVTAAMMYTFFLPSTQSNKRVALKREVASVPNRKMPPKAPARAPAKEEVKVVKPHAPAPNRRVASIAPPAKLKPTRPVPIHEKMKTETKTDEAAKTEAVPVAPVTPAVAPIVPLPAPKFSQDFPEHLETNVDTQVRVHWNKISGAKHYNVVVEDAHGAVIKKYSTEKTDSAVEIPAPQTTAAVQYNVRVTSVNANNVESAKGEARNIQVMRRGSVTAPSLKQIVIEE